jgi:hypothetical protein
MFSSRRLMSAVLLCGLVAMAGVAAMHSAAESQEDPYLRIMSPNGGESLMAGSTHTIKWHAANLNPQCRILIYYKDIAAGTDFEVLGETTPSTTAFSWVIHKATPPTTTASISVGCFHNGWDAFDSSDMFFTIEPPDELPEPPGPPGNCECEGFYEHDKYDQCVQDCGECTRKQDCGGVPCEPWPGYCWKCGG